MIINLQILEISNQEEYEWMKLNAISLDFYFPVLFRRSNKRQQLGNTKLYRIILILEIKKKSIKSTIVDPS